MGAVTQRIGLSLSLNRPPELLDLAFEPLGDLLAPTVSIGVGVILFEGGLSLRLREIEGQQRVLWLLVTLGVLVTWAIGATVTALFTDLSTQLAILVGSILVVSGPTVIGPLLAQVRPHRSVASILKWESIIIDPIGALLAVITFEVVLLGGAADASPGGIVGDIAEFIVVGVVVVLAAVAVLACTAPPDAEPPRPASGRKPKGSSTGSPCTRIYSVSRCLWLR